MGVKFMRWGKAVETFSDLPLDGNKDGDARWVLNAGGNAPALYYWDSDKVGANKWTELSGIGPITTSLYVDKYRTDSYLETGSIAHPFKTIQAAINDVIARGDNSQTKPYKIVIAPGVYEENLVLESASLVSLIMKGEGSRLQVQIKPAAGLALRSNANNANFYDLHMENIQFSMPTEMTGSANGNYFGYNFFFDNCYWATTASALFKNMTYPSFNGDWTKFSGGLTISNITQFSMNDIGGFKSGAAYNIIETDKDANKPYGFSTLNGTSVLATATRTPDFTWTVGNCGTYTGTALQIRACRHGGAAHTIPANAQILAYNSVLIGDYTVTGRLDLYNSDVTGTLSGAGTINRYRKASVIANDSTVTGTTVKDALDTLKGGLPVLSGVKFTTEGGVAVYLKNSTVSTIAKGTVVKADSANDDSIVATALSDVDPIGVVYEDITAGNWGWVITSGRAEILIDNAGGCSREDWLSVSTANAGKATASVVPAPPSQDSHFREVGHALRARGSAGLVFAIIHFN